MRRLLLTVFLLLTFVLPAPVLAAGAQAAATATTSLATTISTTLAASSTTTRSATAAPAAASRSPATTAASGSTTPPAGPHLAAPHALSGLGVLPWYPLVSFPLTDRSSVSVNLANGNLLAHATDLTVAGTGLPLVFDRWYQSLAPAYGTFGNWSMGTATDVQLLNRTTSSPTLVGPSGDQATFRQNPDGSYTSPPGLDATLVKNPDGSFTLTAQASGLRDQFAVLGQVGRPITSLTSVQDHNGNTISNTYNTLMFGYGQLTALTDTQGRQVANFNYGFLQTGQIQSYRDSSGRFYQYGYSGGTAGNLTSYTDSANQVTHYVYDANNNLNQITSPGGRVAALVYDASHRVTSLTVGQGSPVAGTYTFTYNSGNTVVTDPNQHQTTYTLDSQGRAIQVTDALGNSKSVTWTADNHIQTSSDAYHAVTQYGYDSNNNLTAVTLPTGASSSAVYSAVTNIPYFYVPTSTTDAQNHQTTYTYDGNGNLKTVTDALASQNQASASYNANGTVASSTDFNGNTTSYAYDSKGNLTKVTPPSPMGATTIVPDALSRPSSGKDGKGQQTSFTYDPLDRVTLRHYADGSTISTGYDGDGNQTSMVDNTGTTTVGYDARNRETLKTPPGNATVGYAYDAVGNLTGLTDSGGTIAYAYNAGDELTTLTEPGNLGQTAFGYDQNGQRTSTAFPGGVIQSQTYDASGRLATISAKTAGGTPLTGYTYSYQKPGGGDGSLVSSITDSADLTTTSQQYDALNRLTSWVVTPGSGSTFPALTYQYTFDGDGNRTSINANGTVTTLGYNAANEWMTATSGGRTANYTYDANGNELGNDGFGDPAKALAITYNAKNQTTSVTDTQQHVIPMAYTGPGQAERTSAGWSAANPLTPNGPATYAYGSGLLHATDSAGTAYYTRDPGGTLVSQRLPNGTVYHYLTDGQGSVVRLVDPSGTVVATYHYCPTGNDSEPNTGPAASGKHLAGVAFFPGRRATRCFDAPLRHQPLAVLRRQRTPVYHTNGHSGGSKAWISSKGPPARWWSSRCRRRHGRNCRMSPG